MDKLIEICSTPACANSDTACTAAQGMVPRSGAARTPASQRRARRLRMAYATGYRAALESKGEAKEDSPKGPEPAIAAFTCRDLLPEVSAKGDKKDSSEGIESEPFAFTDCYLPAEALARGEKKDSSEGLESVTFALTDCDRPAEAFAREDKKDPPEGLESETFSFIDDHRPAEALARGDKKEFAEGLESVTSAFTDCHRPAEAREDKKDPPEGPASVTFCLHRLRPAILYGSGVRGRGRGQLVGA